MRKSPTGHSRTLALTSLSQLWLWLGLDIVCIKIPSKTKHFPRKIAFITRKT